jgi:hypothetical protein
MPQYLMQHGSTPPPVALGGRRMSRRTGSVDLAHLPNIRAALSSELLGAATGGQQLSRETSSKASISGMALGPLPTSPLAAGTSAATAAAAAGGAGKAGVGVGGRLVAALVRGAEESPAAAVLAVLVLLLAVTNIGLLWVVVSLLGRPC